MGEAVGARRTQFRLSVRARILAAVLITTALGMFAAGGVSYLIAREHTYESIHDALAQEHEEINTVVRLAEEGQSGRAIKGPGDVLYLAIKSSVPDPGEAIVGLVDGKIVWVPDSDEPTQLTVEADAELLAAAAAVRPGTPTIVHETTTPEHERIAFISIPVQVVGSPELGHYVAAVDVSASFAPVIRTHLTYAVACLIALLAIGVVGYQVAGRLLSPLRALQHTAQRISETDLSDRIPPDQLASRDEVADLGRTLNAMLDRLDRSFDHQRRLLDDAGHELRTPITIVRGHLELLDPADPADVTGTRTIALEELDRMQRIVDDLLVLAKSERPDFVRVEPVAVDRLLAGVRDLVAPLGERDWVIDHTTSATVPLDPQRITQALVQLVSNALRFTAPGDEIGLGAAAQGDELALWVRDTGAGIPAAELDQIFERFARGEQSDHSGAGLGLPIVAAIAAAHRGRVDVVSTPGDGSRFTLHLPLSSSLTVAVSSTKGRPWPPS